MISKSDRYPLRGNHEILKHGQRRRGKTMEVFMEPSASPKLAVVVGKNVSLLAVKRNLTKRRVKSVLLELLPKLKSNLVVRAFPSVLKVSYAELKNELTKLVAAN